MIRTRLRLIRGGAAVAAVAVVAAGAAYAGSALHSGTVAKVAIATPAKDNDYGWNQQGVKAARPRPRPPAPPSR